MSRKSWHLDRRTFLMGTGASLALPYLECMAQDVPPLNRPHRFCGIYFPFGVSLPKPDSQAAKWRWFPDKPGRDFQFNESLLSLEKLRSKLSVIGGLSHPNGRKMGAHDTGDTFLTGAHLNGKYLRNTVSLDQVIAKSIGPQTRFASLTMSTDGGVGEPTRSSTLSYNDQGYPIPALNQPQQIFDRFFGAGDAGSLAEQRRLKSTSQMLDRILANANSLRMKLGNNDRQKLDEYLASVRQIEQQVGQAQAWIEIPRPELSDQDREKLQLASDDEAPQALIRTMYDLIYLAFRTDSTRVATYQIASMADASSKAGKFPQLQGFKGSLHSLAHDWNKPQGAENLGKWDRFMAEQFAFFLGRLDASQEGDATILDHSLILYGSSNSQTHNNSNYPLVLAGGQQMGLEHGQFRQLSDSIPLSNLFVTLLNKLSIPTESFADSSGELTDILQS
ncbi:MAG: DUF1552 domain-containing protein [Pirellulaceae bacterium]|nr:DUF1552 domain-containing protein [Pirellulaceae bacterium]